MPGFKIDQRSERVARSGSKSPYKYAHKLYEPRAHQGAVSREALLARLFDGDSARVVLVQGPAGPGQSTRRPQARAGGRGRGGGGGALFVAPARHPGGARARDGIDAGADGERRRLRRSATGDRREREEREEREE